MNTEKSSAESAPQEGGGEEFTPGELEVAREKLVTAVEEETGGGNQWDLGSLEAKSVETAETVSSKATETEEEKQARLKKIIEEAQQELGGARAEAQRDESEASSGSWAQK